MALLDAGGDVGPNSLEMIPFDEQEFSDYCTGEILISAIRARSDYECSGATPGTFASLGPSVQSEVASAIDLAQQNVQTATAITQSTVDANSSPVITDSEISGAPNAVSVGSANALSPFTERQLRAAQHDPINWPGTLTIQANMQRSISIKRNMAASRQANMQRAQQRQTGPVQIGMQPTPGWGNPSGSRAGWCAGGSQPWGKLLLLTGLGLIGASLFDRRR